MLDRARRPTLAGLGPALLFPLLLVGCMNDSVLGHPALDPVDAIAQWDFRGYHGSRDGTMRDFGWLHVVVAANLTQDPEASLDVDFGQLGEGTRPRATIWFTGQLDDPHGGRPSQTVSCGRYEDPAERCERQWEDGEGFSNDDLRYFLELANRRGVQRPTYNFLFVAAGVDNPVNATFDAEWKNAGFAMTWGASADTFVFDWASLEESPTDNERMVNVTVPDSLVLQVGSYASEWNGTPTTEGRPYVVRPDGSVARIATPSAHEISNLTGRWEIHIPRQTAPADDGVPIAWGATFLLARITPSSIVEPSPQPVP